MVSRELYRAGIWAYQNQQKLNREVNALVQMMMGIPGPFVSRGPQICSDEDILELTIAAVEDTHGVTKKLLNDEVFYKDDTRMISISINGDDPMEFRIEDIDDAYDCIAALRMVR